MTRFDWYVAVPFTYLRQEARAMRAALLTVHCAFYMAGSKRGAYVLSEVQWFIAMTP